ncbi:alpha/beta hydrolase [Pedobacter nototheniae]|uniref:alpha/beta fold hydrolase n=1 Tax=Pedobacter nototheniae TaxID=2488994 RepID=UPI00292FC2C4|nr:alpha/beta hydrolase [Pedobacter nototheniae]
MKKKILIIPVILIALFVTGNHLFAQTVSTKPFEVKVTGKGQPMLFIPGLTCSGAVWDETIARYSKNHQCHVFTLAGYAGVAPTTKTPYLDTYKDAIIQYIKDKKLEHVILVGHSIGGFLSLRIATELQAHLQKVIIVDALPFYAGMMNPNAKNGFNEEEAKKALANFDKMDYAALKASQFNTAKFLCADSTKWDKIATWGANSDRKTMAYSMYEMLGNDMRQNIAAIKIPVLVMAAFAPVAQYPAFTKEYVLSSYQQQYQQCKTCKVEVTPSAKHFIMYDAPEWFFSEIDAFIKAD